MPVNSFELKTDKVRRPLLKNEQHAAALIVYGGLSQCVSRVPNSLFARADTFDDGATTTMTGTI